MGGRRKLEDAMWEAWVARALRGPHLREPSPGALRRALALGAALPRPAGRGMWVVLRFDSALEPLPAGLRAAPAVARRALFEIRSTPRGPVRHHVDVRLQQSAEGRGLDLVGELLPPLAGTRLEVRAGRTRREVRPGPEGDFAVRRLPANVAELRLALRHGSRTILLGSLEMGVASRETER